METLKPNFLWGGIIAALSYIFGDHWVLFSVFLLFNVADWITGWIKSRLAGKENSKSGLLGIVKKLGYWLMVLLGFALGYWFVAMGELIHKDFSPCMIIGWFVLASLTVNELRSILENFVEAGYKVPQILIKGLEVANQVANDTSVIGGGDDEVKRTFPDGCNGCKNLEYDEAGYAACMLEVADECQGAKYKEVET